MKNKNIILGIASILISVSGAFASLAKVGPDYIHVRYQGDANFTCSTITPACTPGINTCQVTVSVTGTPQQTPVYENKTSATTCALRLSAPQSLGLVLKPRVIIAADPL